jgi:hypothetical protein
MAHHLCTSFYTRSLSCSSRITHLKILLSRTIMNISIITNFIRVHFLQVRSTLYSGMTISMHQRTRYTLQKSLSDCYSLTPI